MAGISGVGNVGVHAVQGVDAVRSATAGSSTTKAEADFQTELHKHSDTQKQQDAEHKKSDGGGVADQMKTITLPDGTTMEVPASSV